MTEKTNAPAEVVRRVIDLLNTGDLDAAEKLIAPDAINHAAPPGGGAGPAAFRPAWEAVRAAFPDWLFMIDQSVTDGDLVCCRYTNTGTQQGEFGGYPATGKSFSALGLDMVRVRDGRVVEHWALLDLAAMGEQLGWHADRM